MFKIQKSENYSWPVKVKIPVDGGRYHEETFDAIFKRLPASKTRELIDSENMTDTDFAKNVLVDWKGVTDDKGVEIPFSESAMAQLLDVPAVALAVVEAYLISANGGGASGGAKRKN